MEPGLEGTSFHPTPSCLVPSLPDKLPHHPPLWATKRGSGKSHGLLTADQKSPPDLRTLTSGTHQTVP